MNWTAIIPLNWGRDCKTRLSDRLSREQRDILVEVMARHVIAQVHAALGVAEVSLLSPEDPAIAGTRWLNDAGIGLNAGLARAMSGTPALIIHGDLPVLATADVEAVLASAQRNGVAIAPDRHGTGTNALALVSPSGIVPAFGEGSFARHRALFPNGAIVKREGLTTDIDTPEDLDFVAHRWPDMIGLRRAVV